MWFLRGCSLYQSETQQHPSESESSDNTSLFQFLEHKTFIRLDQIRLYEEKIYCRTRLSQLYLINWQKNGAFIHIAHSVWLYSWIRASNIQSETSWLKCSSSLPARRLVQRVCGADGSLQHHPGPVQRPQRGEDTEAAENQWVLVISSAEPNTSPSLPGCRLCHRRLSHDICHMSSHFLCFKRPYLHHVMDSCNICLSFIICSASSLNLLTAAL